MMAALKLSETTWVSENVLEIDYKLEKVYEGIHT
jgi:hypothetical protein